MNLNSSSSLSYLSGSARYHREELKPWVLLCTRSIRANPIYKSRETLANAFDIELNRQLDTIQDISSNILCNSQS